MDRFRQAFGIATIVAAIALGAWFFRLLADDGKSGLFELRIEFRDVRGLKSGADVRYRGVRVGTVTSVSIGLDGEKGVVSLLLEPDGSRLARQASRFWVVVPRFGGLTSGATGLDTLVRDAYVAFLTEEIESPELAAGSLLAGLERPPVDRAMADLDPIERGDLLMTLLVLENGGIDAGASIQFRGISVGEVRRVELASTGTHVELTLRIRERFRTTVTDKTSFWVAKPRVSGALLRGISLDDVGALLSPFIGYHNQDERGVPVPDGYRAVAREERPDTSASEIPASAREQPPTQPRLASGEVIAVEVIYECTEEDWLSPNDEEKRRGSGVMFVDSQGRTAVLTVRSLCDGASFMADTFGGVEIKSEAIRVVVPKVGVFRAGRTWIDPAGGELALLILDGVPPDLPATLSSAMEFEADVDTADGFLIAGAEHPATLTNGLPSLADARGGILVRGGTVVGLVGRSTSDAAKPARIALSSVPAGLRPRP
ncbi:MAG: MlaD family protein [Planctomycetota bacterium]